MALMRGPPGLPGPKGEPGERGYRGEKGAKGDTGSSGRFSRAILPRNSGEKKRWMTISLTLHCRRQNKFAFLWHQHSSSDKNFC